MAVGGGSPPGGGGRGLAAPAMSRTGSADAALLPGSAGWRRVRRQVRKLAVRTALCRCGRLRPAASACEPRSQPRGNTRARATAKEICRTSTPPYYPLENIQSVQRSQYTSTAFGEPCLSAGIWQSMGPVGDAPWQTHYATASSRPPVTEPIDRRRFATQPCGTA